MGTIAEWAYGKSTRVGSKKRRSAQRIMRRAGYPYYPGLKERYRKRRRKRRRRRY